MVNKVALAASQLIADIFNALLSAVFSLFSFNVSTIETIMPGFKDLSYIMLAIGFAIIIGVVILEAFQYVMTPITGQQKAGPVAAIVRFLLAGALTGGIITITSAILGIVQMVSNEIIDSSTMFQDNQDLGISSISEGVEAVGEGLVYSIIGLIFSIMMIFEILRVCYLMVMRYVICIVCMYISPVCMSFYASPSTSIIGNSWVKTMLSQIILFLTSSWLLRVMLVTLYDGDANELALVGTVGVMEEQSIVLLRWLYIYVLAKVVTKLEDILKAVGFNPMPSMAGVRSAAMSAAMGVQRMVNTVAHIAGAHHGGSTQSSNPAGPTSGVIGGMYGPTNGGGPSGSGGSGIGKKKPVPVSTPIAGADTVNGLPYKDGALSAESAKNNILDEKERNNASPSNENRERNAGSAGAGSGTPAGKGTGAGQSSSQQEAEKHSGSGTSAGKGTGAGQSSRTAASSSGPSAGNGKTYTDGTYTESTGNLFGFSGVPGSINNVKGINAAQRAQFADTGAFKPENQQQAQFLVNESLKNGYEVSGDTMNLALGGNTGKVRIPSDSRFEYAGNSQFKGKMEFPTRDGGFEKSEGLINFNRGEGYDGQKYIGTDNHIYSGSGATTYDLTGQNSIDAVKLAPTGKTVSDAMDSYALSKLPVGQRISGSAIQSANAQSRPLKNGNLDFSGATATRMAGGSYHVADAGVSSYGRMQKQDMVYVPDGCSAPSGEILMSNGEFGKTDMSSSYRMDEGSAYTIKPMGESVSSRRASREIDSNAYAGGSVSSRTLNDSLAYSRTLGEGSSVVPMPDETWTADLSEPSATGFNGRVITTGRDGTENVMDAVYYPNGISDETVTARSSAGQYLTHDGMPAEKFRTVSAGGSNPGRMVILKPQTPPKGRGGKGGP